MENWAIETIGLTKDFDGERAVNDLNLKVPQGSVFGLMGPNGAGKSTLIRILMGIYKPTMGKGTILGQDIADPSGQVRQQVGYVADIQNMYPFFKVQEILQFCSKVYANWDWHRCNSLMRTFALPTKKWVRALSKGMQTQLALIIALSIKPRLLILDEPTSGLDPVIRHHFMQLIMQEAASGDTTVFFSTHNLHELERMADQVAAIMKGKLLFNRSLDEIKADTRKIQAIFPEGLPAEIRKLPETLSVEEEGKVFTIVVGSRFAEILEIVKSFNPTYVETVDVGLEELFIHTLGKEGYGHESIVLE